MRLTALVCLVAMAAWSGCGKYQPAQVPPPPAPVPQAAQTVPKPSPAAPTQSGMNASMTAMGGAMGMAPIDAAVSGPAAIPPVGAQAAQPSPPPTTVQQKANVGVGDKGRGYGGGIVTTPIATYFAAKESIAFRIDVPRAIRDYKMLHDDRAPQTQEEFMKLMQEYRINLPSLPQGHRYVYKPESAELFVEHSQ